MPNEINILYIQGSALPNPMRPPPQRLGPQMKSASVDSADYLSSRGHSDPPHVQQPIPCISVSDSNPSPAPMSREAPAYGNQRLQQQQSGSYHGQQSRRSHTSASVASLQQDTVPSQSFQPNVQVSHGGGYPYSSDGGHYVQLTNADVSGGSRANPMNSPPTNIKYSHPPPVASTSTAGSGGMPPQPSGGSVYPRTSPHRVNAVGSHVPQQLQRGQRYPPVQQSHGMPGLHTCTSASNAAVAASLTQSSAGGTSSSRVPPFTGHGAGVPNQPIVVVQDAPLSHQPHGGPQQHQYNQHLSPPQDDVQGSGHMSLPSYGSLGMQQAVGQAPGQGQIQQAPSYPRDDMYLHHRQKGGGQGHQHQHGIQHPGYHSQFDEVEKDSSPPSSMIPPPNGPPLSLNMQSVDQGLKAPPPPRHQRFSHQMPISPDHLKKNFSDAGRGTAGRQQPMVQTNASMGRDNLPPSSQQQLYAYQQQQQQHNNDMMGGLLPSQQQRPLAVKSPVQESSTAPSKLPPSMQKDAASSMYMPPQDQYQGSIIPDPDSDVVSTVSSESGVSSSQGGSLANANENTLEKGIDGDIRRAARNVKKQLAGRESLVGPGGKGGVEAPFDPNLVCPSCGLKFRIGEIQKFKRHAATCTGT